MGTPSHLNPPHRAASTVIVSGISVPRGSRPSENDGCFPLPDMGKWLKRTCQNWY